MSGLLLHTTNARLRLLPQRPLRLTRAEGARLQAVSGVLWITVDHHPDDHVLQPGDSLLIDSTRPVLVTALGGSALLSVCAPAPAAASGLPGWLQQLARTVPPAMQLASSRAA